MIDWGLLGEAVHFYALRGYCRTDVPWMVHDAVSALTCPDRSRAFRIDDGPRVLVGSAEQSFLALAKTGSIDPGYHVACSPCFRNEPVLDHLHQEGFMKVELFSLGADLDQMRKMHSDAVSFFRRALRRFFSELEIRHKLTSERTEDGLDITFNGIELGSYGIREADGMAWTYGTGLAEPRFSLAVKG